MKIFISIFLSLGLIGITASAAPKRKIAQKVECVPLGVPFNVFTGEGDEVDYSIEDFRMLRNSIYAQLGFKFKSSAITNEMTKRGCLKTDVKYTPESLQPVDKKNASLLKSWEKSLKESEQMSDFAGQWEKAGKSATARKKLLENNYCYLSDAKGKYFGILFFNSSKAATADLNGMMNLSKPSWAEPMTDAERETYFANVKYRELDTTSAAILDYATKGNWMISDTKATLGQLQITINSDHKNMKNAAVDVTAANYKQSRMLDCQLTQ